MERRTGGVAGHAGEPRTRRLRMIRPLRPKPSTPRSFPLVRGERRKCFTLIIRRHPEVIEGTAEFRRDLIERIWGDVEFPMGGRRSLGGRDFLAVDLLAVDFMALGWVVDLLAAGLFEERPPARAARTFNSQRRRLPCQLRPSSLSTSISVTS